MIQLQRDATIDPHVRTKSTSILTKGQYKVISNTAVQIVIEQEIATLSQRRFILLRNILRQADT